MRCMSVAGLKGTSNKYSQQRPREGSRLRVLYDLFFAHKGKLIPHHKMVAAFGNGKTRRTMLANLNMLTDFYGLDIRSYPLPNARRGAAFREYALVGEWFGRVYVDYTQGEESAK